jgi:hypothetical protein
VHGCADVVTGAVTGGAAICSILYVLDTLGVSAGQKAAGTSGVLITASEGGFSPCRRVSSGSAPLRSWQKAAGSSTLKPCARQAAFHQDCPPAPLTLAGNMGASSNILNPHSTFSGGRYGHRRPALCREADIDGRCVCASPTSAAPGWRGAQGHSGKERGRRDGRCAEHGHSLRSCPALGDAGE